MEQWLGALRLLRERSNVAVLREEACQLAERLTGADGAVCAIHESEYCVSRNSSSAHGLLDSLTLSRKDCPCEGLCATSEELSALGGRENRLGIFGALPPESVFSVPLVCEGERLGTLSIYFYRRVGIGVLQQRFLRAIAEACVFALRRVHEASPQSRPIVPLVQDRAFVEKRSLEAIRQLSILTSLLERNADEATKRVLHELSQPISVIQEALEGAGGPPPSRRRQSSVIEVDARELISGVCSAARKRVPGDVNVAVYSRDLTLTIDPSGLGELLLLLVEGAANSLQKGRVVVGVSRRGASALLRVFDQGTSREASPKYLAVASAMAEALGVAMELRSFGQVVAVTLTVPLGSQSRLRDSSPGRPRVLLVDDDASVRRALALVLDKSQFDVVALDPMSPEIFSTDFELALVDYNLGCGVTAESILEKLRAKRGAEFPFIILTGEHLPQETIERLGRARVVRKPARVADLVLALRLMMEPRAAYRRPNPTSEVRLIDRTREIYEATGGRGR